MSEAVGAVKALWRFPVKSMRGEQLEAADVTEAGLVGDRAYALVDKETGKVRSGKTPRLGSNLLGCRAAFVEAPEPSAEHPHVRITLPDGNSVRSDAPDVDARLSGLLGRPVKLERAAPEEFTIDQYYPDIEDLDPEGHRDTVTESKLGSAFFAEAGLPSAVPVGAFFDLFPRVRPDDLHPRPVERTPSREPVRRTPFSHERHRGHARGWVPRERLDRSRAPDR